MSEHQAVSAPSILVVHRDRKAQRAIHRILGATRLMIDAVDSVPQALRCLEQHGAPRLIVLDHRLLGAPEGVALQEEAIRRGARACLVLMTEYTGGDLPWLFSTGSLTNLLGHPMPVLAEELTVTALKLLRDDIFGFEKYLSWGVEAATVELDDAAQRGEVVDALGRDVRALGLGPRVATLAALVADELMSNAIYNAPVDGSGRRTRVEEPRHAPRRLGGRDRVRLRYACDARYLAVEVTDLYGSLERKTILDRLSKTVRPRAQGKVEQKQPGAGLGLGLSYSCCNHLVFNIDRGVRSEVIGLIDVRFHPHELGMIVPSFNVFEKQGGRA